MSLDTIGCIEQVRAVNKFAWGLINGLACEADAVEYDKIRLQLHSDDNSHKMGILRLALKSEPRATKLLLSMIRHGDELVVKLTKEVEK